MKHEQFEEVLDASTLRFLALLEESQEVALEGSIASESYDRLHYLRWLETRYRQFAHGVGHADGDIMAERDLTGRDVQACRIPRTEETMEFYRLERKRQEAMSACVKEWLKLVKVPDQASLSPDGSFWSIGVPTALYDTLEAWETKSGIVAAKAFLELHGYEVLRALPEGEA